MKTIQEAFEASFAQPPDLKQRIAFKLGWLALRAELMEVVRLQRECCKSDPDRECLWNKIEGADK